MTFDHDALVAKRFESLSVFLDERTRRLVAAAEARALGYGGVSRVARLTGVSRRALHAGLRELKEPPAGVAKKPRTRQAGGGRKRTVSVDLTLQRDLEALVEPLTRGDPLSPLRWTCKSVRRLAQELVAQGHQTSHRLVAELLQELGYSLQSNVKLREGGHHEDRNAQFEYLNGQVQAQQALGQPVISVDTKKKELMGDFKNSGRAWQPKGCPVAVRVHDFVIPELGRANPYGIYDLAHNQGWVSVGTDHDTAAFAVASIRRWWLSMGRALHPAAQRLLITADGGGGNGSRGRLWEVELQKLANEIGLPIQVCHFPPGTSKWNKIEHRLFSFITQNWRGRPLITHETMVNLIAATTNNKGLKVRCELDANPFPSGLKISPQQMAQVHLKPHRFHGEWNYDIEPDSSANL